MAGHTAPGTAAAVSEDSRELLRVLASMPMSDPEYGNWWGTADGNWLYEQIGVRTGPSLTASLRNTYGVSYEAADVANTAFMLLRQDFVHAYILKANDPWAYLSKVLKREMAGAAGMHFRVELTDHSVAGASTVQAEAADVSLHEAVELTYAALAESAPHLQDTLKEAIRYFAELGTSRLSHLYTKAASDAELTGLGLVREEILAIANAVLGNRPHHGQASLLAAFLQNPSFDPRSSILHRRALNKFENRMAGAARQEALVG